jgi:hypothetical protein
VAHYLITVGYRDPAVYLVPQRVTLEPAVGKGVELDVAGLGKLRVRADAQSRYAVLKRRVIEWPYHYLHGSYLEGASPRPTTPCTMT